MKVDSGSGCIRLIPALLSTVALLLSLMANFWCQLVKFDPVPFHFGLFSYTKLASVEVSWSDGVSTSSKCYAYDDSIDFDGAWKAARVFAIISTIVGMIVVSCMWFALCLSRLSTRTFFWTAAASACLVVLPICQGLVFLILKSDICNNTFLDLMGFFGQYDDKCLLDTGGIMNILATILWFLTGVLLLVFRDRRLH